MSPVIKFECYTSISISSLVAFIIYKSIFIRDTAASFSATELKFRTYIQFRSGKNDSLIFWISNFRGPFRPENREKGEKMAKNTLLFWRIFTTTVFKPQVWNFNISCLEVSLRRFFSDFWYMVRNFAERKKKMLKATTKGRFSQFTRSCIG